jgi:hypothetical protein
MNKILADSWKVCIVLLSTIVEINALKATSISAARRGHISPWKPSSDSEQFLSNGRNLCVQGRRVPDFYVLGVQKSATTSMASDLRAVGIKAVPENLSYAKEAHFFDYTLFNRKDEVPADQLPSLFMENMNQCNGSDAHTARRHVVADYTPDYLRLVPRPKDDYGPGPMTENRWNMDINMPWRLRYIYGDESAAKVQFVVILREPLSQMQSSWYHAASQDFHSVCFSCKAPSFKAALTSHLDALDKSPKELSEWMWVTFYGRQIEHWVSQFSPSQFYVLPMKHYTKGDKDSVCRDLSSRLQFAMDCDSHGVASTHTWGHEHPDVDSDAGKALRDRFEATMAGEKQRLIKVLTKSHQQGMTLAGFHGEAGDEVAVQQWLEAGW